MAKEVLLRCDRCGKVEGVEEFTIRRGGQAVTVDLCEEDGKPVVEAYQLGQLAETAPKKSRKPSHAVIAIEDWKPDEG